MEPALAAAPGACAVVPVESADAPAVPDAACPPVDLRHDAGAGSQRHFRSAGLDLDSDSVLDLDLTLFMIALDVIYEVLGLLVYLFQYIP